MQTKQASANGLLFKSYEGLLSLCVYPHKALPVRTVIGLLTKKSKLGCPRFPIQPPDFAHWHHREFPPKENCLRNLHESINKLEEAYLLPNQSNDSPLKLNTPVDAILPFFDLPLSWSDRHVKDDLVTYMVANDLSVTPMSMTSTMALFKKYNISEVGVLRKRWLPLALKRLWTCCIVLCIPRKLSLRSSLRKKKQKQKKDKGMI
ncbi:hypothetical protein CK203_080245 [Vitis vinifera]|uniref:Uncharacterized protein n=1 Tax=Vitis vinifera TaxID=29760 RepID=A0A438EP53_VITVI|nr:hypothetical protein CK203_080245 [Vitis vinifera]